MSKAVRWLVALLITASVFCGVSCVEPDTQPPAEVSDFYVIAENGYANLQWTL